MPREHRAAVRLVLPHKLHYFAVGYQIHRFVAFQRNPFSRVLGLEQFIQCRQDLVAVRVTHTCTNVVAKRWNCSPAGVSFALASSRIVWTPTNLDRWLTTPTLMVPGTSMGFRLGSSQHRADVLA